MNAIRGQRPSPGRLPHNQCLIQADAHSLRKSGPCILGIDQGTTGTRAVVMNVDGTILSSAYEKHRQFFPSLEDGSRGYEHDAEEIWQRTRSVVEAVVNGHKIVAAGIANQGETVLVWDRESGRPLHHALVWQDHRTQAWMESMENDRNLRETISSKTGLRPDPYFSASKLRWLLDHAPDAMTLLRAGKLCAGTLDAWLIFRLSEGASFVTDASTAARTLLFNIHDQDYDSALLELFGIPREILPEVRGEAFGTATAIPEIRGVPILASLVDQPAAVFGQGCLHRGDVKATYGTGCFVYSNSGPSPTPPQDGILSTIAWRRNGTTTYAQDGGVFAAGSVVEYLAREWGFLTDVSQLDDVLSAAPSAGSALCVPAFSGLAAPFWKRNAKAAFLGIDLGTPKGALVRAALEGIACRVAQVIRAMEHNAAVPIESLRVDGGLVRSREFLRIQADTLGIPLQVLETPEATVMGVSYLAARASGIWTDDRAVLDRVKVAYTIDPGPDSRHRIERLERFDAACSLIATWSAR